MGPSDAYTATQGAPEALDVVIHVIIPTLHFRAAVRLFIASNTQFAWYSSREPWPRIIRKISRAVARRILVFAPRRKL